MKSKNPKQDVRKSNVCACVRVCEESYQEGLLQECEVS